MKSACVPKGFFLYGWMLRFNFSRSTNYHYSSATRAGTLRHSGHSAVNTNRWHILSYIWFTSFYLTRLFRDKDWSSGEPLMSKFSLYKKSHTCWRMSGFGTQCEFQSGWVEVTDCRRTDVAAQSLSDLLVRKEESAIVSIKSVIRALCDLMFIPKVKNVRNNASS